MNNYAKLFQTTPAPWNKGPPPSRNDNAPAFQPDTVMRMPAKPEDSLLGPVRTEEAPPGLGIPDSVIPHLKGPTGERHTVNINKVPRPAVNPSGEQVWIPTTTSTTTTTTTTTTTRRTTRQTTPRARKRPCYSCEARKKAQERLTTLAPKTVKPRPATVEPAIIAPAVSKCKLNERDENSPCKPSPCKSTWTVCKARVACKNAAAKKKQKCVVRRIKIIRNKRHQELIRAKRQKIKSSLKSKRSAKRKSRKIES